MVICWSEHVLGMVIEFALLCTTDSYYGDLNKISQQEPSYSSWKPLRVKRSVYGELGF